MVGTGTASGADGVKTGKLCREQDQIGEKACIRTVKLSGRLLRGIVFSWGGHSQGLIGVLIPEDRTRLTDSRYRPIVLLKCLEFQQTISELAL